MLNPNTMHPPRSNRKTPKPNCILPFVCTVMVSSAFTNCNYTGLVATSKGRLSMYINVGRGGVAGEEDEIASKAFGVHVHAVADAFVEVQFDHAAGLVNAGERGFGGDQVGGLPAVASPLPAQAGVLRAFDAEQ